MNKYRFPKQGILLIHSSLSCFNINAIYLQIQILPQFLWEAFIEFQRVLLLLRDRLSGISHLRFPDNLHVPYLQ